MSDRPIEETIQMLCEAMDSLSLHFARVQQLLDEKGIVSLDEVPEGFSAESRERLLVANSEVPHA